jgi:hypothetical protein
MPLCMGLNLPRKRAILRVDDRRPCNDNSASKQLHPGEARVDPRTVARRARWSRRPKVAIPALLPTINRKSIFSAFGFLLAVSSILRGQGQPTALNGTPFLPVATNGYDTVDRYVRRKPGRGSPRLAFMFARRPRRDRAARGMPKGFLGVGHLQSGPPNEISRLRLNSSSANPSPPGAAGMGANSRNSTPAGRT